MSRFDKRKLQEHLEQLSKEELEKEIMILFQKFAGVKRYYEQELSEDPKALSDKTKKEIYRCYFPKSGKGKRKNAAIRRIISSFKQVSDSKYELADILLYRVKTGLLCYLDPSAPTEINKVSQQAIINSASEAALLIKHHNLLSFIETEKAQIINICNENVPDYDPFISDIKSALH